MRINPLSVHFRRPRAQRTAICLGLLMLLAPALIAGCGASSARSRAAGANARGVASVVAAGHPIAAEAGAAAMRRGGNAVDAAIAAALTLGVVDGHNSGIGGGCFILIRRANGTSLAIDAREIAPAAASRDMYLRNGSADPKLSAEGPLAVAVPGALAGYDRALRIAGRLTLADLILPAAKVAEDGFPLNAQYARRLASHAKELARFPESARVFLDDKHQPRQEGHLLCQPELARTYRAIARNGIGWFYTGEFAKRTGEWMGANGGILTADDFARYRTVDREPLITAYRGHTIIGFPPPSSGGVHVAQILSILEHFELKAMHQRDPSAMQHVVAEAMKLAFADRAHWLGDPAFARVPRGLVDPAYTTTQAKQINLDRAIAIDQHGQPPRAQDHLFPGDGKHTTHIAAADDAGNIVAITATINTGFGSKVVVPGLGVLLNNEMDDFSIQPGVPNAFKLIGAEANAIAPGKRPLSSMSPTIVLKGDRPVLTVGAAGGPTIITQVVQAIINHVDLEMPIAQAIAAPRMHQQWRPDELAVERALDETIVDGLRARGHRVAVRSSIGVSHAIGFNGDGEATGVADPRGGGSVAHAHAPGESRRR